jgi:Uma2 family endonuclease
MSEPKPATHWTWDAYLKREARQTIRYELVDGQVYAMGGGTAEPDTIGNNLRAALHAQLRGKPCRSHGPDLKARAGPDGRYPDALIDCGPRRPGAAQESVAVFEVLSRSTGWIDQSLKLRDYDATPTIRSYVLISQDEQRAMVYTRDEDGRLGGPACAASQGRGRVCGNPRVRRGGAVFRFVRRDCVRVRSCISCTVRIVATDLVSNVICSGTAACVLKPSATCSPLEIIGTGTCRANATPARRSATHRHCS